ncbi:MAG: M28 family peptidase [Acidobacteriota bacterium]|nr:M28 family peptidase [Acidobacteriota bacterium]
MKLLRPILACWLPFCLCVALAPAEDRSVNPKIREMLDQVSEARIRAILEKLESFGTRNTLSNPDDPNHGVGAAREWVLKEMRSYSPRLEVRFDKWRLKKQGQRIFKDVDLYNVIAVLPGTRMPQTEVWVSAHYDSLNLGTRPAAPSGGEPGVSAPGNTTANMTAADFEKNAELPAPGVCDDGSGTAAVMELARVMSQYEFDKTLVFVSFAGEEQGLVGASLQAAKARKANETIEAVLNNDIIGTDVAGNGRTGNNAVNIYSDETSDSVNQQLSRYVKEIGERYMPFMKVNTVFMGDRLGRGGDHTPFQLEGFAAVRVSTPNEIYANQHRATDTLANMSVPYTTRVAQVNLAVAASLALAPKPPEVMTVPRQGSTGGATPPAARRPTPMIGRGSGYDAVLRWRAAAGEDDIEGYAILMRQTTSPFWEQEIYVGKVNTYTLKDVSIDDVKLGVKAIGKNGGESLVSAYVYPARPKAEIETLP